jgi:ribosomal protein L11 methyltransferase
MQNYYRLLLKNVPAAQEDLITSTCFDAGADGVSEKLDFIQESLQYDPTFLAKDFLTLEVFFANKPDLRILEILKANHPQVEIAFTEEENQDWMEEWKKHFNAFSLVGKYWVIPSWQSAPNADVVPIWIDPGLAFGTGTHATTQLAAEHIVNLTIQKPQSLLDVGTGTGILAILAKHLEIPNVEVTEIDEMARDTAKENIEKNKVSIFTHDIQVDTLQSSYDVVVANIIDGVLVQIKEDLNRLLKPGGLFVLSGILADRENYFTENFLIALPGLQVVARTQKDEWISLVVKKT